MIKNAISFVRENDLRTVFRYLVSREAHPLVQFVKYGCCGVAATVAQIGVAYLLDAWFPWVDGSISDDTRAKNQVIANLIAFVFSNATAYTTNVLWVFESGRHSRVREFTFFTLIAFASFCAGLFGGPFLIHKFGINSHLSQIGLVVTSALVNFVSRKFLVFKR